MKFIIIGTAGHIDHGKTALVKALTGIDADRLQEEKRRGITIDLGFAYLQLTPSLWLGFVDVPGHERFVKNMLAGVASIDLVLLVIAADESIKPQTREHFDICRLLAVPRGIIVLTKADLVDADMLGLVKLEAEELVAGSFLEGAPIVPVSSVTSAGLDDLRSALALVAASVPERDAAGFFRLPIDRVFSMKGFGTVATGTLVSGSVEPEQVVEVYPGGRQLRVRGIQVHGAPARRAVAGQRTALNLADIEPADLKRGDTLSEPGRFRSVTQVACHLHLLASAKPLKHRAPVHFHSGAAEVQAEVRLPPGLSVLPPGESACAQVLLRDSALLLPGDRFIIRMFSPVITIGGGVVLDMGPPATRKAAANFAARLDVLSSPDAAARIALLVREAEFGISAANLVARTGMREPDIAAATARAPVIALEDSWYVDRAWFHAARGRVVNAVAEFHEQNPLAPGIARQDLRSREMSLAPPFVMDALLAAAAADLVAEGETVRSRTHRVVLKDDEEQARAAIEHAFEQASLAVPSVAEVLAKSGIEARRARALLEILLREKRLVRISPDLVFHCSALDRLRQLLAARQSQRFQVGQFKEWTGISRKYAIPLLEYLDRTHVTRREGNWRLII